MQGNLFDDLKLLKEKMNQEEKISKEKVIEAQTKEKEEKLKDEFKMYMQTSGVKKFR